MESIGEKLSTRREEKHFSVEQVARETHIARRFIEALEAENFDLFPAESYLIGFLRKYSEFLELDPEGMIALFQNTQIQEQPSPIDELIDSKPKRPWLPILIGVIVVGVAAYAIVSLTGNQHASQDRQTRASQEPQESNFDQQIVFSAEIIEQEFLPQTEIIVPMDGEDYSIEIKDISEPLTLYTKEGNFSLDEGDSGLIDLNRDESPDLRIVYKSVSSDGNPVLRLDKVVAGAFVESSAQASDQGSIPTGATSDSSREVAIQTIPTNDGPSPYFVEILFRGPVLIRYTADDQSQTEAFYTSGQRFQLEVQDFAYFWISNAGKIQFNVAGQTMRIGRDGETAAVKTAWNGNSLELIPMY